MMTFHRDRLSRGSTRRAWSVESLEGRVVLTGGITEFPVVAMPPGFFYGVNAIASGPDGNVWFTDRGRDAIGSIDAAGNVVMHVLPNHSANPDPTSLVTGPDGALWFTESRADAIGRFDPSTNSFQTFALSSAFISPESIAVGPDGNLWFGDGMSQQFGRITPAGVVTAFPIPRLLSVNSIAPGPDGNLWFTANALFSASSGVIGRISTSGVLTTFPVMAGGISGAPSGITAGPDGNLWFADVSFDAVGRITPEGDVTEFPAFAAGQLMGSIASGSDGNLWFTTTTSIGQITPEGVVSVYSPPAGGGTPGQIASGPDGNLWFTQEEAGNIGRLALSPVVVAPPPLPGPPVNTEPVATAPSSHPSSTSGGKSVVVPTIIGPLRALKLFEKRLLHRVHHPITSRPQPVKLPRPPRFHLQAPRHLRPRHAR